MGDLLWLRVGSHTGHWPEPPTMSRGWTLSQTPAAGYLGICSNQASIPEAILLSPALGWPVRLGSSLPTTTRQMDAGVSWLCFEQGAGRKAGESMESGAVVSGGHLSSGHEHKQEAPEA